MASPYRSLNQYVKRYKHYVLLGALFIVITNLFAIFPAQLVRHSFDLISQNINLYYLYENFSLKQLLKAHFHEIILLYGGLILLMALLKGIFLFFQRQTIIVMSRLVEYDLKNEIYQHYQTLPLNFYRQRNTGDLIARISEDVSRVRLYFGPAIMYSLNLFILFPLVITIMFSINVKLALFVLIPLPLLSVTIYFVNKKIYNRSEEIQKSLARLSTFVQEAFSGIRVLKAFNREQDSLNMFTEESDDYRHKAIRLSKVNALFFPVIISMITLANILVVYIGGTELIKGSVTAGNIAEFIIYLNMLTWPVTSLGWVTIIIQRAAASQSRINEFLNTKTHIVARKNLKPPIQGNITFKDVWFTYQDSGIQALKGISLSVNAGSSIGIIGTTGSGKSTIANLICRMYDPDSGTILLDNHDLRDFNVSYLRSQIGYVPQDVFLFSDTIANNVAFGVNDANREDIIRACKDAGIYDNIMEFPEGLDTFVGERGITLSGGQKQRISIARAILRKPKILVFDDCLSAVDTQTENLILNSMKRIMEDRTSVVISHRVSSVKLADQILVINDGYIEEQGTHDSLLESNGLYKSLYEKQLEDEEVS